MSLCSVPWFERSHLWRRKQLICK